MADYTITFARSARKELETLESHVVRRIFSKIEALAKNLIELCTPFMTKSEL
jgi:mRNA-degrading endonuclease RelE of RelBE toxin-antitoxin system